MFKINKKNCGDRLIESECGEWYMNGHWMVHKNYCVLQKSAPPIARKANYEAFVQSYGVRKGTIKEVAPVEVRLFDGKALAAKDEIKVFVRVDYLEEFDKTVVGKSILKWWFYDSMSPLFISPTESEQDAVAWLMPLALDSWRDRKEAKMLTQWLGGIK